LFGRHFRIRLGLFVNCLPVDAIAFIKSREKAKTFLLARGATIVASTNEWEVLRFHSPLGTGVVYKNKRNRLTFTGQAIAAFTEMQGGKKWEAVSATPRKSTYSNKHLQIIKRDGEKCFLCLKPFTQEQPPTVDHLVPLSMGGPNNLSNYVLMHSKCNNFCGSISPMEKIALREKNKGGK
jgi:HNH endonuclease